MSQLKLITFDLDNTLWPVDTVIRRANAVCDQWLAEHHPDAARAMPPEQLARWREQAVRDNPSLLSNLTALRKTVLMRGFEAAGYRHDEAQRLANEAFDVFHDARNQVQLFPGARQLLEALAEHYIIGALTNGNADLEKIGLGHLFAFHHSSESVGQRKPAPDMFHAALKSADVNAGSALHVGDHPHEDVHAARSHGLHAVWANLLEQPWPDSLPPHQHQIRQLEELPDLLHSFDPGQPVTPDT